MELLKISCRDLICRRDQRSSTGRGLIDPGRCKGLWDRNRAAESSVNHLLTPVGYGRCNNTKARLRMR
eukprot:5004469-Pleurochrysis_carterae.AAC.10